MALKTACVRTFPSAEDPQRLPAGRVEAQIRNLPSTRYQGSKRRFLPALAGIFGELEFDTAIDAFGGTGSVAYLLKALGKQVVFNDALAANAVMATALVENDRVTLDDADVAKLLAPCAEPGRTFIADVFDGVYFTRDENLWLDGIVPRIAALRGRHRRALAWYALFQAALAKRPYNLFHRRNLYMRTAQVARSFGNKRTWDRPFAEHFAAFAARANGAVFAGERSVAVRCGDALEVPGSFDLVYIDPPYVSGRGVGVDYAHFYHFLEGLLDYSNWGERVDWESAHRRMKTAASAWVQPARIASAFAAVLERYAASTLVVSYRSDGVPAVDELVHMLRRHKRKVQTHRLAGRTYALSTNRAAREIVLVGE